MPQGYFPQKHKHSRVQTQNLSCRRGRKFEEASGGGGEMTLGARQRYNIRANFNL